MRKHLLLLLMLVLVGCSTKTPTSTSVESDNSPIPDATYEYNKYDFGEYTEDAQLCTGYNVVFTTLGSYSVEDAESDIWDEVTKDDGYACHTVWFTSSEEVYKVSAYDLEMWEQSEPDGEITITESPNK